MKIDNEIAPDLLSTVQGSGGALGAVGGALGGIAGVLAVSGLVYSPWIISDLIQGRRARQSQASAGPNP
jgi:hypothetical protein